ncbi:MAG: glutamine-hydrolyzing carbamoyl-phosphate synthase small subunit [bacterium]|nr:glutamine-hydrolyzing carbamoyl-phosphate synthase small subunit [bacterium]
MTAAHAKRGALALADGTIFRGTAVGASGIASGEVVFNTAMTGYQEIATDPSYAGQIIVMTAPHIGNYGASSFDDQAAQPFCTGFVVRSMARLDSNWRSEGSFAEWLRERDVIALSDIDTRRLTRHIRDHGSMPAAIGADVDVADLVAVAVAAPRMVGQDLTRLVTTTESYLVEPEAERVARVVAYDFGIKKDILDQLTRRGAEVHVVPAATPAESVMALNPTGVFLSNGPGDPEPLTDSIAAVRSLLGRVPIFGICLGHQVLGLALGARTHKLPFGHHGGNHPVRNLVDGTVEITSQNHGFTVDLWSQTDVSPPTSREMPGPALLPTQVESDFGVVRPTHQNLNDGTLEGLECRDVAAFSVQYHPEAAPGPNDAVGLFDRFAQVLEAV